MTTTRRIIVESPRGLPNEIIVRQATPEEVYKRLGITKEHARLKIIRAYESAGYHKGSHGYVRLETSSYLSIEVRGIRGNYSPLQALKYL